MAEVLGQSSVRVFLAAALSPHVQAATRWIGVSALSRRAFALSGKDSGSPLLHWLAAGRPASENGEFAAARRLGVDRPVAAGGFRDWYRSLNHGYPFLDYSSDDALASDARLMSSYAAQSDAPSPSTPWPGPRHPLPPGRLELGGAPQTPCLDLLAGWLRIAAGITRLRQLPHTTVAYRTSPSGGARHPTDIAVGLGAGWPDDLRGNWWYDPLAHALVRSDWSLPEPTSPKPGDVVFGVTSHVERAMWRYRDVRAFRPVLIDAGHIVETLVAAVSSAGWSAAWHPAPGLVVVGDHLDPIVGYVVATPNGRDLDLIPETWWPGAARPAGALRTNPLLSITITADAVHAENHLRAGESLVITPAMVDALAYATPSSRRDRPTAPEQIAAATGVDPIGLDALVAHGLLLNESDGDRLWRLGRAWFQHDWFLSLLAHVEEASAAPRCVRGRRGAVAAPVNQLPAALDRRRTCRALTGAALPTAAVERLLAAATVPPAEGVSVVVVSRHDSGSLRRGTYVLDAGAWTPSSISIPTEEEVSTAAIGQPWARGFAILFWLVPSPDDLPGSWEAALVDCGRIAQRLALTVSHDPTIGVFQSPALVDELLAGILQGHGSDDGAYLVGIGVARDGASDPSRLFRPADIFTAHGTVLS